MNSRDLSGGEMPVDDLTWREQEILLLLAERLTNREIADRLHLAENTVKDYVGKILSKLYVKNRREAVARAKALGLLDGDPKPVVKPPTNLPAEPTPFIGRRDEVEEVSRHLAGTRLLTLVGPGGIGKTRLALKAAGEAAGDFKDGCFYVSLAPIRSADHIVQTTVEAVRFPLATHEDPRHQLLRYLRKRHLLLVMDNFEHLLDGAGIVGDMLQAAPAVKILATSRERLNLKSETIITVGGMAFPDQVDSKDSQNYDAINLFVQSASKVRPGFDPSPDELGQIVNICQIVGGMPLAIELAAAWLHILNVDEIVRELEKGLDILSAEVRDAPERHRSIRAVFDYSWSLLDQNEREIFMRLSVFRGGFTREAAQQVSGATLQLLAGLVDKSFLSHDPSSGRLEIHELLRQYTQERLEGTPEASISAQKAHAAYYAEFMGKRRISLNDDRQMLAVAEIEADIENVRGAWRYYLDRRDVPQMWLFVNGFWQLYWFRGWNYAGMELFTEAARVLREEEDEDSVALRALVMAFQTYFMAWLGLSERGYELASESVEILKRFNHPEALGFAYDSLIVNAYFLNRITEEAETINDMLQIAAEIDNKWLLTHALYGANLIALINEDFVEAERLAKTSLKYNEEFGNVISLTFPLNALGFVAFARGEYEKAREFFQRCLDISEEVGYHWATAISSKYLGKVALSMGELGEAEKYLVQSLRFTEEIGFIRDIINLLYEFACLRAAEDKVEEATELLALVIQHPASQQFRWLGGRIRDSARELLAQIEDELPPETYAAALERGREAELDGVVADLVRPKS